MTGVHLLLPFVVLAPLAWFAYRLESSRRPATYTAGRERVVQSLTERLRHGEISREDYGRLIALIS